MEIDELNAVVSDWYRFGRISSEDRARLKAEAFRVGAVDPEGCKTCPNFWNNVMHNLISYLRENNSYIMKATGKYALVDGTGSIMLPMSSVQFISEGQNSEFLKLISDPENEAMVGDVLEKYPQLSAIIVQNPAYKEVAESTPAKKEKQGKKGAESTDEEAEIV